MKAKAGIGIEMRVEFHVLPEEGETMDELLVRLASSEYEVMEIDRENNRVLVGRID